MSIDRGLVEDTAEALVELRRGSPGSGWVPSLPAGVPEGERAEFVRLVEEHAVEIETKA